MTIKQAIRILAESDLTPLQIAQAIAKIRKGNPKWVAFYEFLMMDETVKH